MVNGIEQNLLSKCSTSVVLMWNGKASVSLDKERTGPDSFLWVLVCLDKFCVLSLGSLLNNVMVGGIEQNLLPKDCSTSYISMWNERGLLLVSLNKELRGIRVLSMCLGKLCF